MGTTTDKDDKTLVIWVFGYARFRTVHYLVAFDKCDKSYSN
jgi:hypothetical protein